ncbi:hypothetical protein [Euzebya sp.]|uniref:hypothetical protein n=1 Tax=Euzebya sp. TaxID=1971409 RepID=UPI00351685B9
MSDQKPIQRTLRLRQETADRLEAEAARGAESANALADRLLLEGLRALEHPLIQFRTGASGDREPHLVGTRLKVRDVIHTAREHHGDLAQTAGYFDIAVPLVEAAVAYYSDFTEEIDQAMEEATAFAERQRRRWEHQRQLLA